jgi:hemolysin III
MLRRHDRTGVERYPTSVELWADGIVHSIGVALAVAGTVFVATNSTGTPSEITALWVYLTTLLVSIGVSAAYNIWPVGGFKRALRRLDHSAIFLLIAGTYSPFLVQMKEGWHLAFVWTVAALGVSLKMLLPGRFDRLSILLYLALGWSGTLLYQQVMTELSARVLTLIAIGGILYSLGVIFHVWSSLRFQNAIWHAFVVSAAGVHFAAVWTSMTL